MDLKNQDGADVQGNGSAKEGFNSTTKNNHAKPSKTGKKIKANGRNEPLEPAFPKAESVKTELKSMYEEFIEFLNQIYWEGYAEALASQNPAAFQMEYNEFFNAYGV